MTIILILLGIVVLILLLYPIVDLITIQFKKTRNRDDIL